MKAPMSIKTVLILVVAFLFLYCPVSAQNSSNIKPITLWYFSLKQALDSNWGTNEKLSGINNNLETIVFLNVSRTGQLKQILIEKSSGNHVLDEHVLKTVKKSIPFKPLPEGMTSHKILLKFSPKGLM